MKSLAIIEAAEALQEPFEELPSDGKPWRPHDEKEADRALGYVGQSVAAMESLKQQAAAAIATINARLDALLEKHQRRVDFYEGGLAIFAEENKSTLLIGKARSREFIAGRIGWRKKPARLDIVDPAELEAWLPDQDPSLFRMTIKPDKKALAALVEATGIIPPGCEWTPSRDELHIDVNPLPTITTPDDKKVLP